MESKGVDSLDRSFEKTTEWLDDLAQRMGWDSRQKAYVALRAALHALRDRLTLEEAVQLGAQLPLIVRGFYYEGWHPSGKPDRFRHKDEYLERVRSLLRTHPDIDAEALVRAVFGVLTAHVSTGEIEDVKAMLPAAIRELWPR